jgi:hypothetical protein
MMAPSKSAPSVWLRNDFFAPKHQDHPIHLFGSFERVLFSGRRGECQPQMGIHHPQRTRCFLHRHQVDHRGRRQKKVWSVLDYKKPQITGDGKTYRSLQSQVQINCKQKIARKICRVSPQLACVNRGRRAA